jgi:carotenoid 1,2-hydratase
MTRPVGSDRGHPPRLRRTLEDAPFYSRSLIDCQLFGTPALAFHESLSLERFNSGIVRLMLPFRMPRRFF